MSLRIVPLFRFTLPPTFVQRVSLIAVTIIMAVSSLLIVRPNDAKADYNTFSQTASHMIGSRTTYSGSPGLAFDSIGNSYFVTSGGSTNFIRVVSPTNTFVRDITPYAQNLPYGSFESPPTLGAVAVDPSDNIYVAVRTNTIEKYTSNGTYIRTIGGSGSGDGKFGTVGQIATDSQGNLYAVDKNANRIQKFDSNGNFLLKFGSLGSGDSQFNQIVDLEVDPSDNLYVADGNNRRVKKFSTNGTFLLKFGQVNTAIGCPTFPSFNTLKSVTIDSSGAVYVGAYAGSVLCNIYVQKFDASGTYLGNFSLLNQPSRVKMNRVQNKLYSQEISTYEILARYSNTGTFIDTIGHRTAPGNFVGDNLYIDDGVAQDSNGNTYIVDSDGNYRIQKFDASGNYLTSFGSYGSSDGQFRRITNIAINAADQIYIGDGIRNDIQVFSTAGSFLTKFGSSGYGPGQFNGDGPGRLRFASNGDLYILNASTGLSGVNHITIYDSSNTYKTDISSYQRNGQTINYGSILGFDLTSTDDLVIVQGGSPGSLMRISKNNIYLDEKPLTMTGANASHKLYAGFTNLYVDRNDTIYLTGTEADSPDTPLLQRNILAAINFDVPNTADFRYVKSLDSPLSTIYFSSNNTLYERSDRFNYVGVYDVTGTVRSPSAPINLAATSPARGQIAATWSAPADSGDGQVLGYRVDYKPHSSSDWVKHTTTSSASDTIIHLPTGSYDIRVYAYNLAGLGIPATLNNIDVIGVSNPSAPRNLSVVSTSLGIATLNWQYPNDDGGETITTYKVEYKPHANNQWALFSDSVSATTALVTGLLDDTYDFRVSALNSSGTGAAATFSDLQVANTYGFKEKLNVIDGGYIQGIEFDGTGKRYENDYYNDRVNVYRADGTYEFSFGTSGSGTEQLYSPRQGAIGGDNRLYIPDSGNDRVQIFNLDGTHVGSFGTYGTGDGEMSYPVQVYIDDADNLYVVSEYNNIQKYTKDGTYLGRIAIDAAAPVSMTMDAAGNIFVANASYDSDHGIIKYAPDGATRLDHIGSEGSAPGKMYEVYGMAINTSDQLIANDSYNGRVQIFDTNGDLIQIIGNGFGNQGDYLTFDDNMALVQAVNGDIYLPNGYSPYIQVLNYTGKTTAPTNNTNPPSEPLNASASNATPNQLTLSWQAPASTGDSAITNYKIEHKLSSQSASSWTTYVVDGSTFTYTLTNLQATCHDIQVSAGNSYGYSNPSLISCTQVNNPAPPVVVTPPVAPPATQPDTPTSQQPSPTPDPTIQPSQNTTTPKLPSAPAAAVKDAAISTTTQTDTPSVSASASNTTINNTTISWQPPRNAEPQRYIIEYRDASIPESDTSTPWKRISEVPGNHTSATFTLPSGSYTVRVAAVLPGDTATNRIILGVAKVSIVRSSTSSTASQDAAQNSQNHTWTLWMSICVGIVTLALLSFVPFLLWRHKRNQQQAPLPPR